MTGGFSTMSLVPSAARSVSLSTNFCDVRFRALFVAFARTSCASVRNDGCATSVSSRR